MRKFYGLLIATIVASTLSACSVSPVGTSFDQTPPKLVDLDAPKEGKPVDSRAIVNGKIQRVGWDRPSAFGSVPSELQADGRRICQAIKYNKAIGYHPRALDYAGNPIKGGGFYCGN
ncbi:hypothetical protein [Thiothrix sp.]|uniref:hypothetical protein n=1 Tax=Thiothrix sp. TaxID=1032 RepID=UPI00257F0EF9|nr:hypothetical protein [Thiothrix sp.]